MKILHSACITPHRCGLYETAREFAAAERKLGHDARLFDPTAMHADRGVPTTGLQDFLKRCDVIVSHSGLSQAMRESNKPVLHMRHGRPRSTFLIERNGDGAIYTYLRNLRTGRNVLGVATLWPEHRPYWQLLLGREVHCVPPPVDLEAWTPDGPKGYRFGGKKGDVNLVVADVWRKDVDPFHVINAFARYAVGRKNVKLHLYGVNRKDTALGALLDVLQDLGALGEVKGWIVKGLANAYRAADALLTPHYIATRTIREALACGCQVVADDRCGHVPYRARADDLEAYAARIDKAVTEVRQWPEKCHERNRRWAVESFDAMNGARELVGLIERLLKDGEQ